MRAVRSVSVDAGSSKAKAGSFFLAGLYGRRRRGRHRRPGIGRSAPASCCRERDRVNEIRPWAGALCVHGPGRVCGRGSECGSTVQSGGRAAGHRAGDDNAAYGAGAAGETEGPRERQQGAHGAENRGESGDDKRVTRGLDTRRARRHPAGGARALRGSTDQRQSPRRRDFQPPTTAARRARFLRLGADAVDPARNRRSVQRRGRRRQLARRHLSTRADRRQVEAGRLQEFGRFVNAIPVHVGRTVG